jgi:hypothetical protein
MNDSISKVFDVVPVGSYEVPLVPVEPTNADNDIDLARSNLKMLIQVATDALTDAMALSRTLEHPKNYETVVSIITAAADLNAKLIETHKDQQKMKALSGEKAPNSVTNNSIVFTGTPAELLKHLDAKKNS